MLAKYMGFIPTLLNFEKLVSIPNALIAIVNAKVSRAFISLRIDEAVIKRVKSSNAYKPTANQGIVIFVFSPVFF